MSMTFFNSRNHKKDYTLRGMEYGQFLPEAREFITENKEVLKQFITTPAELAALNVTNISRLKRIVEYENSIMLLKIELGKSDLKLSEVLNLNNNTLRIVLRKALTITKFMQNGMLLSDFLNIPEPQRDTLTDYAEQTSELLRNNVPMNELANWDDWDLFLLLEDMLTSFPQLINAGMNIQPDEFMRLDINRRQFLSTNSELLAALISKRNLSFNEALNMLDGWMLEFGEILRETGSRETLTELILKNVAPDKIFSLQPDVIGAMLEPDLPNLISDAAEFDTILALEETHFNVYAAILNRVHGLYRLLGNMNLSLTEFLEQFVHTGQYNEMTISLICARGDMVADHFQIESDEQLHILMALTPEKFLSIFEHADIVSALLTTEIELQSIIDNIELLVEKIAILSKLLEDGEEFYSIDDLIGRLEQDSDKSLLM